MYESYYDKEFIIVDRFSYRDIPLLGQTQEIERGDVIIFSPGVSDERKFFIKRVIGLPGETLKIENGKVYLMDELEEFQELNESAYLSDDNEGKTTVRWDGGTFTYQIPEGKYFVMGDNRNHSTDSRTCFQSCALRDNYIEKKDIVGKLLLDLWYFSFQNFSFTQPDLNISTIPKFFSSPGQHKY